MNASPLLIGFGAGILVASGAAWVMLRRHLRRVRVAERRARQAERMAEIGAMTGGLAHEIKNPLSTIGLNAQLLVEGIQELGLPQDESSRLLNRTKALQRETERLRGILQDFLEFAGQIHLERRDHDLNAIVAELADFYHPEAERQGVMIRTELTPGPIRASVDVKAVKQALLNLIINATHAMAGESAGAAGGTAGPAAVPGASGSGRGGGAAKRKELVLKTTVRRDDEHPGAPGTKNRTIAELHVIDTGPGIDPGTLAQIFKPYFTTKSGGSGLGLPTSRRLIEEHGGRLTVASEPGNGSDFALVFPME